ncbi:hypothetical protein [uncultured Cocleimonas sp.]|uniref:hypothetical protein n=1 Tax=uncultured Cocleimonas sp. TaxID=1051587 RepID=UPI0026096C39|nr:hypothetical protein [uncultured Cocleimonas sp.]
MGTIIALSIIAIIIAAIVWYKAKVFIAEHDETYNRYLHYIDFHLLKELKKHDESVISDKAEKHHRNVKIAAFVIIAALLVILSQSVY